MSDQNTVTLSGTVYREPRSFNNRCSVPLQVDKGGRTFKTSITFWDEEARKAAAIPAGVKVTIEGELGWRKDKRKRVLDGEGNVKMENGEPAPAFEYDIKNPRILGVTDGYGQESHAAPNTDDVPF